MAPSTVIVQTGQQVQSAVDALGSSLPKIASHGRQLLQQLVATLATGGQGISPSLGVESALTAATEIGVDHTLNVMNQSLNVSVTPDGQVSSLDSFRNRIKQEVRHSLTHITELPESSRKREQSSREFRIGPKSDTLDSLSMPFGGHARARNGDKSWLIKL